MNKNIKHFVQVVAVFLSVLLLCSCNSQKENPDLTVAPETPLPDKSVTYKDFDKCEFFYIQGLRIPTNWHYEEASDGFILTEQKTGTEIVFTIADYNPEINNTSNDTLKQNIKEPAQVFSFDKITGSNFKIYYNLFVNNVEFHSTELIKFNYKYTYTLRLISSPENHKKYIDILNTMNDSLILSSEYKTIPIQYNGFYHAGVKVLTMYPRDWKTSFYDTYYTSAIANSTITTTYSAPISNFKGIDKTTYNGIMQKTVANFSTSTFSNNGTIIHAQGYYTENSIRYIVCNTIYNLDGFSINIVFVAPENEFETYRYAYDIIALEVYAQ